MSRTAKAPTILVLRPGALGDTILTYPILAALRRARPTYRIVAFGHQAALDLARPALVDEARSFDDAALSPLFSPRAELPPPASALHETQLAVLWLAAGAADVAARLQALGVQQVASADPRPPAGGGHIVDHLASVLAPLGIPLPSGTPHLSLAEAQREDGRRLLRRLAPGHGPAIALHAGSGSPRKCWPAAGFAELSDRLARDWGARVLLVDGPADRAATAQVLHLARHSKPAVLSGLGLASLAALLAECGACVGNDSGISHLAAALGTPTVAIYGPTDPAVWGVRATHATCLSAQELSGDTDLAAVAVADVLDALARLMAH